MSKRVLLTGAGGSIGIHVVALFLKNTDWEIVALDSFHHKGYKDRLERLYKDYPEWKDRVKEFQHNLTCPISTELREQMGHIDYILHLACYQTFFLCAESCVDYSKQRQFNFNAFGIRTNCKTRAIYLFLN